MKTLIVAIAVSILTLVGQAAEAQRAPMNGAVNYRVQMQFVGSTCPSLPWPKRYMVNYRLAWSTWVNYSVYDSEWKVTLPGDPAPAGPVFRTPFPTTNGLILELSYLFEGFNQKRPRDPVNIHHFQRYIGGNGECLGQYVARRVRGR